MSKMSDKERKTSIVQAAVLGRVERLAGNGLEVNPFPEGSDQWRAFQEGWTRSLDNPISRILQQNRKTLRNVPEPA